MILDRGYQLDYFCGWRYLSSANYRVYVKQRWGKNLLLQVFFLIECFIGIFFTTAATLLLTQLIGFGMTGDI